MSARLMSLGSLSTKFLLLAIALIVASTAGCGRTAPVKDMGPTTISARASQDEIQKAILAAGDELGWVMKVQSPGLIVGALSVRTHLAVIEIPFSSRSYSIRYKDSRNLKFNATDKTIHHNYNNWVQSLNSAILARLAML